MVEPLGLAVVLQPQQIKVVVEMEPPLQQQLALLVLQIPAAEAEEAHGLLQVIELEATAAPVS
jgi:hypothetical protein